MDGFACSLYLRFIVPTFGECRCRNDCRGWRLDTLGTTVHNTTCGDLFLHVGKHIGTFSVPNIFCLRFEIACYLFSLFCPFISVLESIAQILDCNKGSPARVSSQINVSKVRKVAGWFRKEECVRHWDLQLDTPNTPHSFNFFAKGMTEKEDTRKKAKPWVSLVSILYLAFCRHHNGCGNSL